MSNQCLKSDKIEIKQSELDEDEKNLVKLAIIKNEPHIINEILDSRTNKNPYMNIKKKQTLLHYLARHKSVQIFKTVSDKIYNVFVLDKSDKFPSDIAAERDNHEIVSEILYGKGAIMAKEFHFGYNDEPFIGYRCLTEALFLSGKKGHVKTFFELLNFMNFVNRSFGKSAIVLNTINEERSQFSKEICDIIDDFLENLNPEVHYEKLVANYPLSKKLTSPMTDFMEKIIQIVFISQDANYRILKQIDYVPIIKTSISDAIIIISKITNEIDDTSEEMSIIESPRKFKLLLSHVNKVIHEHQEEFNEKFSHFLLSAEYGYNIDFLQTNQEQLFELAQGELIYFGLKPEYSMMDMVRYSKTLWGMIFPQSKVDIVLEKILIQTLHVEPTVRIVQSFLLSNSKSFLKFVKSNVKTAYVMNKDEL